MLTTVVGSYPVITRDPHTIGSKIADIFWGSHDPFLSAIELAVRDQVESGVDIISDGQVRGDMIEGFARTIPGMVVEGNTPKIVNKIQPAHDFMGVNDIKFALKTAKNISKIFNSESADNKKLFKDKSFNEHFKGIKGIITGPTTLVSSCRIEGFYNRNNKAQIILDMAAALKKEAIGLQDAGAAMIQIDEPFLSTGLCDVDIAKKALKIVTQDLTVPVSIHVCGDIGEIFNKLLKFPVQIIDCEFAGMSSNINILEQLFDGSKKIGLGCIDTKIKK